MTGFRHFDRMTFVMEESEQAGRLDLGSPFGGCSAWCEFSRSMDRAISTWTSFQRLRHNFGVYTPIVRYRNNLASKRCQYRG